MYVYYVPLEGGGGGGVAQKRFVRGDSTPRSNPSPFYIPFSTEKASFRISSMDKWKPVQIRWVFNCCKCTIKPESFIGFFTAMKCIY